MNSHFPSVGGCLLVFFFFWSTVTSFPVFAVLGEEGGGGGGDPTAIVTTTTTANNNPDIVLIQVPGQDVTQLKHTNDTTTETTTTTSTCIVPSHDDDAAAAAAAAATASLSDPSSVQYSAYDDASWAIMSTDLSQSQQLLGPNTHQEAIYQEFIRQCVDLDSTCQREEEDRIYMNRHQPPSMINYTKTGFAKIQAPPELFQLLSDFWNANYGHQSIESDDATAYQNTWQVPTTLLKTEHDHFIGGGWNLSAAVWNAARDILEDWTGQKLAGSSVYGIRLYHNQSILTPHVDRLPLVSSAIINVAQDVEEDWVLEVYGHDGKATNVTMKPGDMVLYESHSVIHGRPFPLRGKYYANIFVHFEPMGPAASTEPLPHETGSLPPYVIPHSKWATENYLEKFPHGWTLLTNVVELARKGDLYTMKYVAQRDQTLLHANHTSTTHQCSLLTVAILNRHVAVVMYLIQEMQYDVNLVCTAQTPLDYATRRNSDHDDTRTIDFLLQNGGVSYNDLITQNPDRIQTMDYPCVVLHEALVRFQGGSMVDDNNDDQDDDERIRVRYAAKDVMAFLFEVLRYDINMICGEEQYYNILQTPMDIRLAVYGVDNPRPKWNDDYMAIKDRDPIWAYLRHNHASKLVDLDDDDIVANKNGPDDDTTLFIMDRCTIWRLAIQERMEFPSGSAVHVVQFLVTRLRYDVNMICPAVPIQEEEDDDDDDEEDKDAVVFVTPLDWAWEYMDSVTSVHADQEALDDSSEGDDDVIRFLEEHDALTYAELVQSDEEQEEEDPLTQESFQAVPTHDEL